MLRTERIQGGLWGAVVGDALGVPVEFRGRKERERDPVTGMRGYGTFNKPPGTWSDDSSLLLCTVEALVGSPDLKRMADLFRETGPARLPCGRPRQVLCCSARFLPSMHGRTCNSLKIKVKRTPLAIPACMRDCG